MRLPGARPNPLTLCPPGFFPDNHPARIGRPRPCPAAPQATQPWLLVRVASDAHLGAQEQEPPLVQLIDAVGEKLPPLAQLLLSCKPTHDPAGEEERDEDEAFENHFRLTRRSMLPYWPRR